MKPVYFIPVVLFVLLAIALAVGLTLRPSEIPSALVGKTVPAFEVPDLLNEGETLSAEDLKDGRMKLLNIFGSWCEPCKLEHPILMVLKEDGVPIYALDYKDDPDDAKKFLADLGNPFERIGVDEGRTGIAFGMTGVPETFVIDHRGRIRYKQVGPITEQIWAEDIKPVVDRLRAEAGK